VASTGTTPNSRLYTGEELDLDLGLINLRARQYEPSAGRFLTIDPLMGNVLVPASLSRYLYANGDPSNLSDPKGTMVAGGYVRGAKIGIALVTAAVAAYGTRLAAQKLTETVGSAPPPSMGEKKQPLNCFVSAQLARQQCLVSGRNAVVCEGVYLAALLMCVKGQMFDPLNPHW
jgi:RHS repeat-associated protein